MARNKKKQKKQQNQRERKRKMFFIILIYFIPLILSQENCVPIQECLKCSEDEKVRLFSFLSFVCLFVICYVYRMKCIV